MNRAAAFVSIALLVCWGTPSGADVSVPQPATLREQLYSVRVNGQLVSDGSILLFDVREHVYATQEEVQRWRFSPSSAAALITYHGVRYVDLSTYDAITVAVDSQHQELDITASPHDFAKTDVQLGATTPQRTTDARSGGYLNYAAHADTVAGRPIFNGLFGLGVSNSSGGAFTTNFVTQDLLSRPRAIRLDTGWQFDNPDNHRSLHVGDFITQPASLGIPVRFAGISVATDFSTEPQFITFPTASARGVAALPSVVDVLVNGYKTGSALIPAGPYDIGAIAGVSGMNQAQVVVRDVTGSAHIVSLSFYTTPTLLKPGLSSYAYEAGTERFNYGIDSGSYGHPFAQGTWRHGFTDRFTSETHVEITKSFQSYGLGGTLSLNDAGTFNAGLMQSIGAAGTGRRALVGYEYRTPRLSAFAQVQLADQAFREIGYDATTGGLRSLWQTGLSFILPRGDQFSFTSINRRFWGNTSQQFLDFGFARAMPRGTLLLGYVMPQSGQPGLASATFVTSFGARGSAVTSASVQQGKVSQDLAMQLGMPPSGIGDAIDFREQSGASKSLYAQATHQTQGMSESLALLASSARADLFADFSSSLIFLDHRALQARRVMDSYGLVELPDYPNVDVLLNNHKIGETDNHGDFVLPSLLPYSANTIGIDPSKLPISANIASINAVAVPNRGGAVIVRFATQRPGGVLITVVDSNGQPLSPGTIVRSQDSNVWPIAEDGQAYLAGIAPGKHTLQSSRGTVPCEFDVTVPNDVEQMPNLGKVVCVDEVTAR